MIWFVPIKLYALPIELPFNLEPYRLFLLALVFAWGIQIVDAPRAAGGGRPGARAPAADRGRRRLDDRQLRQPQRDGGRVAGQPGPLLRQLPAPLRARRLDDRPHAERRADPPCRSSSAEPSSRCSRSTRRARRYNFFDHLAEFVPILDKQEREVLELRGGQLRVHASAQHPIAMGVALMMILPIAVYLAKRASTTARTRLWVCAALVCAMAAVTTVSRTTVLMAFAMGRRRAAPARRRDRPLLADAPDPADRDPLRRARRARRARQVVLPQGGPDRRCPGPRRRGGSGRFADVGPGLRLWTEEPVFGHGPRERDHVRARGDAPRAGADRAGDLRQPVHEHARPARPARPDRRRHARLGEHAAPDSRRAPQHRAAERPDRRRARWRAPGSAWRCSSSTPSRSRSARSCSSSSPHSGCARRSCQQRRPILVESRTTPV